MMAKEGEIHKKGTKIQMLLYNQINMVKIPKLTPIEAMSIIM